MDDIMLNVISFCGRLRASVQLHRRGVLKSGRLCWHYEPGERAVTLSMGGLRMEMERKWEGNELGNGILNLKFKMGNYQDNDGMAWKWIWK